MGEKFNIFRLITNGQLKFRNDEIDLLGQAVTITPVDFVVTLQKFLEKRNSENLIYYAAKDMGVRWFKHMYDNFKISPEDVIRWGSRLYAVAGWGDTRVPEIN